MTRLSRRNGSLVAVVFAAFFVAVAAADPPAGEELVTLIKVDSDRALVLDLVEQGADAWGPAMDGGFLFRVSAVMLEELQDRGVGFVVEHEDVYAAYEEWRGSRIERRDEDFISYHDLASAEAAIRSIARDHPDIAAVEIVGESIEGRPILALRISDEAATVHPDRRGMLVVGCHHAREWIGVEVSLYFAEYLTDNYLVDGDVTRLLRYGEVWILPILNPDGFLFSTSLQDRWWRKNRRDNGDGTFGVDLNRNYSVGFGGEGTSPETSGSTYPGPGPFSEPETQAIRDLMTGSFDRTFVSALSFHSYGQLVLYPNGHTTDPVDNADEYDLIAAEMTAWINDSHSDPIYDYDYGQTSTTLYTASGVFTDWSHHEAGAMSIIIELRPTGWPYFELPDDEILPTCVENLAGFMFMAEETVIPDIWTQDSDLDGFVDADDYCPGSDGTAVDFLGCTESQQDMDGDGVSNLDDLCPGSLPRQEIDADGCRVPALFRLEVGSNIHSVEVLVDPVDIDSAGAGDTGRTGFTRDYAEEKTVALIAPTEVRGSEFLHWVVNRQQGSPGVETIELTTGEDVDAEAVYRFPEGVEVTGHPRIPDRHSNGIAYVAKYSAQLIYSDGLREKVDERAAQWSLVEGDRGVLIENELIAYDVSAEEGEIAMVLEVLVDVDGTVFKSEPFTVSIFDSNTLNPNCREIRIDGPDRFDSDTTIQFAAMVRLDGEAIARSRSDEVVWMLEWPDGATGAQLPAAMSEVGELTTEVVSEDAEIVLLAAYADDNGLVRTSEKAVTILAVDVEDSSSRDLPGAGSAVCGAAGIIGYFGLLFGLLAIRLTRR